MLAARPRFLPLEAVVLVLALFVSIAPPAVLPTITPILATFGSGVPWPTKVLLASGPFFTAQAFLAAGLLLLWLAERFGFDQGLGARLRGAVPAKVRGRKLLSLAVAATYFCGQFVFCVAGVFAPQFQGELVESRR